MWEYPSDIHTQAIHQRLFSPVGFFISVNDDRSTTQQGVSDIAASIHSFFHNTTLPSPTSAVIATKQMDIFSSCGASSSSFGKRRRDPPADANDSGGDMFQESETKSLSDTKSLGVHEMNGLSVQERERVYEEIHGVADLLEETPELLQESLEAMRLALGGISRSHRKALDRAFFLRPSLQTDDKLHLLFLRSTNFQDPELAAHKMCRYFEHKLLLFGEDKFVRKIQLDDLTFAERQMVLGGSYQYLPTKDRSGRVVHLATVAAFDYHPQHWKSILRYFWYQKLSLVEENEDIQKRGIVQVVSFYGPYSNTVGQALALLKNCQPILNDWPLRVCSFHLCYDSLAMRSVLELLHMVVGKDIRLRERSHFGSKMEAQYSLMSYGILVGPSLTPGKGFLSREAIELYIQERLRVEQQHQEQLQKEMEQDRVIMYPSPKCVLMKHSGRFWMGNANISALVCAYSDRYRRAPKRLDKTMIAMEIVQRIQLDGGHFVERSPKGWKIVDDQLAKDKVAQALRAKNLGKDSSSSTSSLSPLPEQTSATMPLEAKRARID